MPGRRDEVVADSGGMPEWRARGGICVSVGSLCWPVVRTPRRSGCPVAGLSGCHAGPGWQCGPAVGTPRLCPVSGRWVVRMPGCPGGRIARSSGRAGCGDAGVLLWHGGGDLGVSGAGDCRGYADGGMRGTPRRRCPPGCADGRNGTPRGGVFPRDEGVQGRTVRRCRIVRGGGGMRGCARRRYGVSVGM